jgi:serine/threonine-protein kinase
MFLALRQPARFDAVIGRLILMPLARRVLSNRGLQNPRPRNMIRNIFQEGPMSPERWRSIEELYHAALERTPAERTAFLADACHGDEGLKHEVESLLAQESGGKILDRPASEMLPDSGFTELAAGVVLGQYRIIEHLGTGGMGTVYKATDTKLGRAVALKLIRPEMLEDAAALARFEREARTLAAVNHPHIATIYGFEERDGIRFLALEYVPGPTLAERLRRGPLFIHEAMAMCNRIAAGLEAAHARAIIHRDLKPANIKIGENGQLKVLDFGLAKPMERKLALSTDSTATVVKTLTHSMMIIGTPAYMSPEQASGKELDARTDIWSFGCVLYEALTARRAFAGSTATEILAAVLHQEPDWTALPAGMPAGLVLLLKRCLRKDPATRLRDIGDARIELEDLLAAPEQAEPVHRPAAITRRTAISALSGAAAGVAISGPFAISRFRGAVPRRLTQFAIPAPGLGFFVISYNRRVAISPDSTHIALGLGFGGSNPEGIYLRSIAELEAKRIKDIPGGGMPFFSPDGRWIGFATNLPPLALRKVALTGGASITICPHDAICGATWADGDIIYWVDENPGGLMGVPAAGGQPKEVVKLDFAQGERQHRFPCALPGGKAVLSTVATPDTATFDDARIVAISLGKGKRKVLLEGGTHPRYSSGHLLYARDGKVLAVRFDPDRLELKGQSFTALEGVQMSRNGGVANFDVSAAGDLIYISGACDTGQRTLVWVDRSGNAEPLSLAPKSYLHPRLSPDARKLAIEVEGPNHDLYVYDFDRGVLANITTDGVSHWPVWSPDGRELVYRSGPMGHFTLWRVPADRSRKPQQVPAVGRSQNAESWSPDGRTIAYTMGTPGVPASIMVADVNGARQAESFSKEKAPEGSSKFSPDGRWLAYCSNESGRAQVYVQAFPGPGPKIQISSDGGTDPVWKPKGGELYFRNGDSMMAVTVSTAGDFKAGRPQELWKGHYSHGMSTSCGPPGATSSNYDVTADGKRFLMVKDEDPDRATSKQAVVVLGWVAELSRMSAKA